MCAKKVTQWKLLNLKVSSHLWDVRWRLQYAKFQDTVTDFSWEPKGERFAIVSSNDPNLGNPGPGVTIKTDVSFYQLERGKNFRPLSELW